MAEEKGGLWAVIPAPVRRDDQLPPNAKLLYGDLSALTCETGYCYATNEYLMGLYGWADRTIQRLLAALEERGYIRIEQIPGRQRRIFCGVAMFAGPPTKMSGVGRQKCRGTPDNSVAAIKEIKIIDNNTPYNPPKGGRGRKKEAELEPEVKKLLREYVGEDRELMEAMAAYIDVRLGPKSKAVNTPRAIRAVLAQLDKLSGGDREQKILILLQSAGAGWIGVFALRGSGPRPERGGVPYEDRRLI